MYTIIQKLKKIAYVWAVTLAIPLQVCAAGWSAPGGYSTIGGFLGEGIKYVGAATALFGAVQAAMGFRKDDNDGKIKGIQGVVAGALTFAIGGMGAQFFTA
ncbi:MAG: hypothetical protein LBM38_01135 [Clostridiales bacterium]|jgi:hypothetical protein|nr:hypothetical protein [Clostridiales bacterium]